MPNATKYAHINWTQLRELIAQGASMRELAKTFGINYYTLAGRSYRERWNVMAIRANLPPRSKAEKHRKDSSPDLRINAVKNGVTLPLVKLANYYQSANVETLLSDSTKFFAFVHAALKFLSFNDNRSGNSQHPTVNLQLLAMSPNAWKPREIPAAPVNQPIEEQSQKTDSVSVTDPAQVTENQGTPNSREAKK